MNIVCIIVTRQQLLLGILKLIHNTVLVIQQIKIMKRTSEASAVSITHEGDSPSEYKDIGTSSCERNELSSNDAWQTAFVSNAGKTCDTGPENGRLIDCISHEPQEFASHLAHAESECGDSNEEPLPSNIERGPQADTSASNAFVFKRSIPGVPASVRYIEDSKFALFEYITDENAGNKMTPLCTLHPMAEQCPVNTQTLDLKGTLHSQYSHFRFLDAKNELADKFTITPSQPSHEQMKFNHPVSNKEDNALIGLSLIGNGVSVNEKGGSKSDSLEKDDSHESAESSNSREPCAKGKRVWSYGRETLMGSKRMRKSVDRDSCSGSHVREDSSFMNWVSSVTKGFFKSDLMDKHSLDLIPHMALSTSTNPFSCPRSNDTDHNAAHKGLGFGSIFRNLYCPRFGKPIKTVSPDYQKECADSRRLHFDDRPAGSVKACPSPSMRNDQHMFQFSEPPLTVPCTSLRNSSVEEKAKHNMEEYCNFCNVGSSSSSFQNGSCCSPSEGKDVGRLANFGLNKFSGLSTMNKAGRSPSSLWITRFSSKVAAPTPCEKLTNDCPKILRSQNEIIPVRDCSSTENVINSSDDPMDSCGSKKVHAYPKTKVNPILPSQTLKSLEPITSIFAKRLDAFRNIRASELQDDVTPEDATCFFCGKNGHIVTECSEVMESEIENVIQKVNSYGTMDKASCVCIHCFMHGHWAVACPYVSSSYHGVGGNTCDSSSKTTGHGSDAPLFKYRGIGTCSKGADEQGQFLSVHGSPSGEVSGTITEVQNSNVDTLDIINLNGNVLRSYLIRDGFRKTEAKGKQIASTSTGIGSVGKPLVQNMDVNKADRQCLVFDRIRKLRLSRTQIIRWMESSISHSSLEGFYLRVRIRKWEGDLGGTGYHVACINGASGEKTYGRSKSHLPVDIGGLACLIDCRFISSHDFVEDELEAWWSATLRRGGKLPSEEDLDKKLRKWEKLVL